MCGVMTGDWDDNFKYRFGFCNAYENQANPSIDYKPAEYYCEGSGSAQGLPAPLDSLDFKYGLTSNLPNSPLNFSQFEDFCLKNQDKHQYFQMDFTPNQDMILAWRASSILYFEQKPAVIFHCQLDLSDTCDQIEFSDFGNGQRIPCNCIDNTKTVVKPSDDTDDIASLVETMSVTKQGTYFISIGFSWENEGRMLPDIEGSREEIPGAVFLGCFQENSDHDLKKSIGSVPPLGGNAIRNIPAYCAKECLAINYPFFALQNYRSGSGGDNVCTGAAAGKGQCSDCYCGHNFNTPPSTYPYLDLASFSPPSRCTDGYGGFNDKTFNAVYGYVSQYAGLNSIEYQVLQGDQTANPGLDPDESGESRWVIWETESFRNAVEVGRSGNWYLDTCPNRGSRFPGGVSTRSGGVKAGSMSGFRTSSISIRSSSEVRYSLHSAILSFCSKMGAHRVERGETKANTVRTLHIMI